MKISKEKFMECMQKIAEHDAVVEYIFSILSEDISDKVARMASDYVSFLQEVCEDKNDWIPYWLYELEFGKKYREGYVKDKDGKNISLGTLEDLWNLLEIEYYENHKPEDCDDF